LATLGVLGELLVGSAIVEELALSWRAGVVCEEVALRVSSADVVAIGWLWGILGQLWGVTTGLAGLVQVVSWCGVFPSQVGGVEVKSEEVRCGLTLNLDSKLMPTLGEGEWTNWDFLGAALSLGSNQLALEVDLEGVVVVHHTVDSLHLGGVDTHGHVLHKSVEVTLSPKTTRGEHWGPDHWLLSSTGDKGSVTRVRSHCGFASVGSQQVLGEISVVDTVAVSSTQMDHVWQESVVWNGLINTVKVIRESQTPVGVEGTVTRLEVEDTTVGVLSASLSTECLSVTGVLEGQEWLMLRVTAGGDGLSSVETTSKLSSGLDEGLEVRQFISVVLLGLGGHSPDFLMIDLTHTKGDEGDTGSLDLVGCLLGPGGGLSVTLLEGTTTIVETGTISNHLDGSASVFWSVLQHVECHFETQIKTCHSLLLHVVEDRVHHLVVVVGHWLNSCGSSGERHNTNTGTIWSGHVSSE